MTDIVCRVCGEPYDCSRGLRHDHTDLTEWQFNEFLKGLGCPCCDGELRRRDENDDLVPDDTELSQDEKDRRTLKWAQSLQSASDEVTPFPGFDEAVNSPWRTGEWTGEPPSFWEALLPADKAKLQVIGGENLNMFELDHQEFSGSGLICNVLYEMSSDWFSSDLSDLVRNVNYDAFVAQVDELCRITQHTSPFVWLGHELRVCVAKYFEDGSYSLNEKLLDLIYETERSLADYPCLDDEELSRREAEQQQEAWDYALRERVDDACEFLGNCDSEFAYKLLGDNRDAIGSCDRYDDGFVATITDEKLYPVLAKFAGAPGWEFYRSSVASVWIAVMNPQHKPLGHTVSAVVISGSSADAKAVFLDEIRVDELETGSSTLPREHTFAELLLSQRAAFLNLIRS